jgi:phosphoribosylamine--glycine ligase
MNLLVVGSGGREHALCWHLAQSPTVERLYCAPGNGGIAGVARCVDIEVMDFGALIGFCKAEAIEFVVVGPEVPLVAGLVDALAAAGIRAFGPNKAASELEGSKRFTKALCHKYGIPTGAFRHFTEAAAARAYVTEQGAPIVVKADGLAAGKGVTVATTVDEAITAIDAAFAGQFGDAGQSLVIEEFLAGEEASFHVLVDGRHILALAGAQDHKAACDGDTGPNTGGMGAYSPAPVLSAAETDAVMEKIIRPTVAAMAAEGRPYQGVLYCGLMMTADGPQVVEFNCRFGDPECQVILMRLKSDLLPALIATTDGSLDQIELGWYDDAALTVVMAAQGYPGAYEKGSRIRNLETVSDLPDVTVFHAGTERRNGDLHAVGGRVLAVTGRGRTVAEAQARAYEAVATIDWPGGYCRSDIGWRALAREKSAGDAV